MLSPEQWTQLLSLLQKIADRPDTITKMQDWPMLVTVTGMFGGVMLLMIGGGIGYILSTIERDRRENKEDHDKLWKSQADCQDDCCPRGREQHAR